MMQVTARFCATLDTDSISALDRTGASLFIPKDNTRRDAFRIASIVAMSIARRVLFLSFFFNQLINKC